MGTQQPVGKQVTRTGKESIQTSRGKESSGPLKGVERNTHSAVGRTAPQEATRRNPGKRFTVTRLATLPPGRHKDTGQEGLYLLVRPKKSGACSRTWVHRINYQGGDTYLPVGHFPATALSDARTTVQEQRELLSKGIDPRRAAPRRKRTAALDQAVPSSQQERSAPSDSKYSIEFLVDEFMELYIKSKRVDPAYTQRVLNLDVLSEWRGRDARTIKPREVIELLDGIVARGSPIMANRTAKIIDQLFRFAIHRGLLEDSPVKLLYAPGGDEEPRTRVLSDGELKILITNRDKIFRSPSIRHAIMLLLLTLQRRGELCQAKWADIDFDAKTWRLPLPNTKTKVAHIIPLSDWAIAELRDLKTMAGRSSFVFPNVAGDSYADPKLITRSIARIQGSMKKKWGFEQWTGHDLRRTGRTGLSSLNVTLHIAERCLNHSIRKSIEVTYDRHDYLDQRRVALDKWAAHLASLAERTATT